MVDNRCVEKGFSLGIGIAYRLLYNDEWDEQLQQYAVKLLEFLKRRYPENWHQTWENEGFLGTAYDAILDYDKRYESFRKAYNLAEDPPPGLLIKLAGCVVAPGELRISLEEAQSLLERSMKTAVYKDAIQLLSHIFWLRGDREKSNYWKNYDEREKTVSEFSAEIVPECIC